MRDVDIALVLAAGVLSPAASGGGSSITVDDALSDSSKNPVQNKVIAKEVGDLKSALDTIVRSGAVNDTASGSIASFTDGADNVPVKDLTVAVEPVQDLHGYDNPWPAGGGKNLFNGTFLQGYWAYADGAWINSPNWITTEKIPCKASTSYTVSADAKATRWQGFVWYDANGDYISTDNLQSSVNIGLTKTSPSTAAYLIFNIAGYPGSSDTIAPSDVTHFQLEEGSSSTAWSPYSNICPISGWTGANVTRTGKNLFALIGANTTDVIPTINETTGEVSIADTTAIKWVSKPFGYSDVVAEQTYIFSATGIKYGRIGGSMNTAYPNAGAGNIPDCTTSGGGITALVNKNATARTFTPHFTGRIYWHFCTDTDNGSSHQAFTMTPMIEIGSTASSFEPYSGTTYPISIGQTVYGGTLDVTTGKLTVTHGNIASYSGETMPGRWISSMDVYSAGGTPTTGAQVVYELSTPQTYQLTPTEVTLLLGENNIWSDGEMTLTYLADGNASDEEALNILLGGRYVNNHSEGEPTDREALNIVLGGNER